MPIAWLIFLAFSIVQFFAFLEGGEVWLGAGTITSAILFAVLWVLGPLGGLVVAIVGYLGATRGWGWEWWQALAVCFPYLVLAFILMALTGILAIVLGWRLTRSGRASRTTSFSRGKPLQKVRSRRRSPPPSPPE